MWPMALFGSLHAVIGIGLTYGTLAGFLNHTRISAGPARLAIEHGPLPWLGDKVLDPARVEQLYCLERRREHKGTVSYTYDLHARLRDGRGQKLVGGLTSAEQAAFLEQQLEALLGIADQPVAGEHRLTSSPPALPEPAAVAPRATGTAPSAPPPSLTFPEVVAHPVPPATARESSPAPPATAREAPPAPPAAVPAPPPPPAAAPASISPSSRADLSPTPPADLQPESPASRPPALPIASPPMQTPAPPVPAGAALPTVEQSASGPEWEVTLTAYGPYARFAAQPPTGTPRWQFMVAEFTARNLQNRTGTFTTSDFAVRAGDGRRFPAAPQTGRIERGISLIQAVTAGATTENRVVFDLDPAATDLTLDLLGVQFRLPR
jgi:hypothetical protein